jgi:hypothetical protein
LFPLLFWRKVRAIDRFTRLERRKSLFGDALVSHGAMQKASATGVADWWGRAIRYFMAALTPERRCTGEADAPRWRTGVT